MTLPGTITAATPAAPPERAVWRAEIIETVKLAWPIALTQLGQIAMMTTDLALIGRLGDGAIAAVGLAHRSCSSDSCSGWDRFPPSHHWRHRRSAHATLAWSAARCGWDSGPR